MFGLGETTVCCGESQKSQGKCEDIPRCPPDMLCLQENKKNRKKCPNELKVLCSICQRLFIDKNTLTRHLARMHGKTTEMEGGRNMRM
eukprot:467786-Hanusia_phi.AAC.2